MGVASAGLQIQGQRQMAKAQAVAQSRATTAEQQRYLNQMSAMRARERQENIAEAQQRQQITKKAREARSTARVSAGEAGVAGLSIDALLNSFTQNQATAQFALTQQAQFQDTNRLYGFQDAAGRNRAQLLRINQPIQQPNLLGSTISGVSTGLSTFSTLKTAKLF